MRKLKDFFSVCTEKFIQFFFQLQNFNMIFIFSLSSCQLQHHVHASKNLSLSVIYSLVYCKMLKLVSIAWFTIHRERRNSAYFFQEKTICKQHFFFRTVQEKGWKKKLLNCKFFRGLSGIKIWLWNVVIHSSSFSTTFCLLQKMMCNGIFSSRKKFIVLWMLSFPLDFKWIKIT